MRPDPYKRAKSRQYKAKHGIIDPRKPTKQESVLPSNISEENFSLEIGSDDQDEICLNFDGVDLSYNSNIAVDNARYKYTKELYEKLFEHNFNSANNPASSTSISKHLSQKLSLPEHYFYEANSRISINNVNFSENDKSGRLPQLKLRNDERNSEEKDSQPKVKTTTDDKLALEDWLDQVL